MRPKIIALFLSMQLLALGACGTDTEDAGPPLEESAGEDVLTKDEFLEEGDAICTTLDGAREAAVPPDSPEGMPTYIKEQTGHLREAIRKLEKLAAPSDGEDIKAGLLASWTTQIEVLDGASAAYASGDTVTGGDLMVESDRAAGPYNEALAYGFTECGEARDVDMDSGEPDPAPVDDPPAEG